jgi:tetratricopeptide (TPR) repeat protein
MSKSAQLKRKAAELEQKRQYDRALTTYSEAIEAAAGIPEELDIPLYNRVGDLHLRLGDLDKAVSYYETAVDLYADGGFFNNAIALCNKVLRHAPDRTVIYYKLGKISAKKGFNSDAKQNFLEYASRMERGGDTGEAFRALKEFADLCPGQDDVRLMLAEQLARAGRTPDALEQLQIVYQSMLAEDRGAEAAATLERIRVLDPDFAPRAGTSRQATKREGLVFLDVDYGKRGLDAVPPSHASDHPADPKEPLGQPLSGASFGEIDLSALPVEPETQGQMETSGDGEPNDAAELSPLAGLRPVEDPLTSMVPEEIRGPSPMLAEFEPTSLDPDGSPPDVAPLAIERTSYGSFSADSIEARASEPITAESITGEPVTEEPVADESIAEESIADTLTGYVASLSSDVAAASGGLADDLGVLPPEAIQGEQAQQVQQNQRDAAVPAPRADDDFVDLNEWLLEDEAPRNPRMTAEEEERPADTVQTDFSEMLETFKAGIAANVDENDADSHYDLGVAYMEMGLFDEAIAQFQKAMRADASPEGRVRAYESLGQSFIEKNEDEVAISSLSGALKEPGLNDAKLVGVLYLLGYASERLGRWSDAEGYYRRVFAADINFRDIGERLKRAELMA